MKTVHATYENGVFRPRDKVALPEHSHVEFEPRLVSVPSATVKPWLRGFGALTDLRAETQRLQAPTADKLAP